MFLIKLNIADIDKIKNISLVITKKSDMWGLFKEEGLFEGLIAFSCINMAGLSEGGVGYCKNKKKKNCTTIPFYTKLITVFSHSFQIPIRFLL